MDENIVCELDIVPDTRLVDRRRAAAHVGVTAGRFEQLVRDNVVPPPVMVDNKRRWPLALLDVARDAVVSSMPCPAQIASDAAQDAYPCERDPAPAAYELPDQAWFEQRARFVQRVRRSLLSGNEIRLLREFKLFKQNEISMFGYYGSFEALMVARLHRRDCTQAAVEPSARDLSIDRAGRAGDHGAERRSVGLIGHF